MFYDIVLPDNNEDGFIAVAEKLGIDGIAFAYKYENKGSIAAAKKKLPLLQKKTKIKLEAVFDAGKESIYKVHDLGEIAIADGSRNSRDVIARYKPDIVYNLEADAGKDFAKSRNSGLDKATCQFAKSSNVTAAFAFSSILTSANLPQLLGRIAQNIKLCKKYRIKTAIASFAASPMQMRQAHDLKSFLISMGMYTKNADDSIKTVFGIVGSKGETS